MATSSSMKSSPTSSDFEAHNAKPYVQAWFAKLPELAEGGVHTMKMKILTAPKE